MGQKCSKRQFKKNIQLNRFRLKFCVICVQPKEFLSILTDHFMFVYVSLDLRVIFCRLQNRLSEVDGTSERGRDSGMSLRATRSGSKVSG